MDREIFKRMLERWPSAIVYRGQADRFSGYTVSAKSLANLDSRGEGPEGAFRIGGKVVYPVESFVSWLEARSRPMREDRPSPMERARRARRRRGARE